MRDASQFGFSILLLVSSLTCGQKPGASMIPSDSQPLQIRIAKAPSWEGNCLQVSIRLVNRSRFPIFLPHEPFEGIEAYSSVNDPTNTLGHGAGEVWILVYGWTDVFYGGEGTRVQGSRNQKTFCIEKMFPVRSEVKGALRQVRLQGKLRVYVSYTQKLPAEKISKQRGDETTATSPAKGGNSDGWTSDRIMLEIPIPCSKGVADGDCIAPPMVFPGEHDVWWIDPPKPPPL